MPSKASNRPLAARRQGQIEKHQGEPFQSLQSPPIPSPLLRCTIRRAALSTPSHPLKLSLDSLLHFPYSPISTTPVPTRWKIPP